MYVDTMCVELSTTPQDESSRSRGSCWQETRRRMLLVDVFFWLVYTVTANWQNTRQNNINQKQHHQC